MVEDHKKFLNTIKNLEPYLVEFEKKGLIKTKKYLDDYTLGENKRRLIIVINHNEYTFFANNKIWKV